MDTIDQKIINMLQKNARVSLKELSAACFISSPAIAARINKLEKAGIITGYHTTVALPGTRAYLLWGLAGDTKKYKVQFDERYSWLEGCLY